MTTTNQITMLRVLGFVLQAAWHYRVILPRRCMWENSVTTRNFRAGLCISEQKFLEGEASHEESHAHITVNLGNRKSQTAGGRYHSGINYGPRFHGRSMEEVVR